MQKYVKVNGKVENRPIPAESQIDNMVVKKIRQRYSVNDELKMARIGSESQEWQDYNDYVEECRDWGQAKKLEAAADRETWGKIEWNIENETRKKFIERLETEGLL